MSARHGRLPASLDLALVGNGTLGILIDAHGEIVWGCFPRFDGDPVFCSLLQGPGDPEHGFFSIELAGLVRAEQEYLTNTPVLCTRLYDDAGGCVEITDFAPRFRHFGRTFSPMTLVRRIRRVSGSPRIRLRCRPASDHGRVRAETTSGSNHIRFIGRNLVLRLTTDVPITALLEENQFFLDGVVTVILGPDESVHDSVAEVGRNFLEQTTAFWLEWVRYLAIPFDWQDAVIRAAITLELNVFEDTGAIVAALTTSIPEAPNSGRNWDYRYCWLRDAYFVINALNRLGSTRTMERYLGYILNLVADAPGGRLQPLYGISGRAVLEETIVDSLAGYRGMGPVRVGNDAYRQVQHDVYGSAILAVTHIFFDRRLVQRGNEALFHRLEALGNRAAEVFDQPDAGIWELRGTSRIHTFSSVMCWAGCDRLAKIAAQLGIKDRADYWAGEASRIHEVISRRSWNPTLGSFVATMDGDSLDASLLRLHEVGFVAAEDPRFVGTVKAIGAALRRGDYVFRYIEKDDFGEPQNAFLVCTFWYINALAAIGERDAAHRLFETVLARRNRHGLLAEHIDPATGEQWGNFVQTYSMVGIIGSAIRLSQRWDQAF